MIQGRLTALWLILKSQWLNTKKGVWLKLQASVDWWSLGDVGSSTSCSYLRTWFPLSSGSTMPWDLSPPWILGIGPVNERRTEDWKGLWTNPASFVYYFCSQFILWNFNTRPTLTALDAGNCSPAVVPGQGSVIDLFLSFHLHVNQDIVTVV